MLQIAIWGIALMLVVKGFDILHQQKIAERQGSAGSPILAIPGSLVAFIGAALLLFLSSQQVASAGGSSKLGVEGPQDEAIAAAERLKQRLNEGEIDTSNPNFDNLEAGASGEER